MELENSLRRDLFKGAMFWKVKEKNKKIYSENKGMQVGIINVNQWKGLQE